MIPLPIDHVAIAVPSIAEAAPIYERLTGTERSSVESLPDQGVEVCFIGGLELIEPTDEASPVHRFLTRRGQALHHVAYLTEDIVAEMGRLRREGFTFIDEEPRAGARGHRVAFLHPANSGKVLFELVERR